MSDPGLPTLADRLAACNPWWQVGSAAAAAAGAAPAGGWAAELLAWWQQADGLQVLVIEGARQTGRSTLLRQFAARQSGASLWPLAVGGLRWTHIDQLLAATPAVSPAGAVLLIDDVDLWPAASVVTLARQLAGQGTQLVLAALPGDLADHLAGAGLAVARLRLQPGNFADFLAWADPAATWPEAPRSLRETFDWPRARFNGLRDSLLALDGHFREFLLRGGYRATWAAPDLPAAQAWLTGTLVQSALAADGPARHGVRRVDDLLHLLQALAEGSSAALDVPDLCARLAVERPTVRAFLQLLDTLDLVHRLPPLGYGTAVQRARFRVCVRDSGLLAALRGHATLPAPDTAAALALEESALLQHLQGAYGARGAQVRVASLGATEPALVVGAGAALLAFGRHPDPHGRASARSVGRLARFCATHALQRTYLVTRTPEDCGPLLLSGPSPLAVMRLPLPLLCWWLARATPRVPVWVQAAS